jgi:hypothetical protein
MSSHDLLARALIDVGSTAAASGPDRGAALLDEVWPHAATSRTERKISERQRFKVFKADGFRCRYSGDLLFFPPYLRSLSALWPEKFPYHRNGKSEITHIAYWSHIASLEHVEPVATGGAEAEDNWITTSMARNMVRSRFSLTALDWTVKPRAPLSDWDGGVGAMLDLLRAYPHLLDDEMHGTALRQWQKWATENC